MNKTIKTNTNWKSYRRKKYSCFS